MAGRNSPDYSLEGLFCIAQSHRTCFQNSRQNVGSSSQKGFLSQCILYTRLLESKHGTKNIMKIKKNKTVGTHIFLWGNGRATALRIHSLSPFKVLTALEIQQLIQSLEYPPFLRHTLHLAFSADMSHLMQASNIPSSTCTREKVCASRIATFHFSTAEATQGKNKDLRPKFPATGRHFVLIPQDSQQLSFRHY